MWSQRLILSLLIYSSFAFSAQENTCDTNAALKKFGTWVNRIDNYEVTLDVKIANDATKINSILSGISNKRLKIELQTKTDKYTSTQVAIFDGKYQWVESTSLFGVQAVKLNIKKLTKPARPFDTNFYLMGAGLINGEDFPATLKILLSVYDFDGPCKNNEGLILTGRINKHRFIEYIKRGLYAENKLKAVDKYSENFEFIELKLSNDAQEIKGYSLGTKDHSQISYIVLNNIFNQAISEENFIYRPQKSVEIEDITNDILNTLTN